jgi:hypothetical protein
MHHARPTSFLLFSHVLLGCFGLLSTVAAQQQSPEEHAAYAITESALVDALALRPGMKRADVEKAFVAATDGFRVQPPMVYAYRKCYTIHIDIEFSGKNGGKQLPDGSPDDIIVEVSRPYLEQFALD